MTLIGETLARHLACFGDLPGPDRDAVVSLNGELRDLARNADIIRTGDHPTDVVMVMSGLLYRYEYAADGQRQVHSFYVPTEAPCLESLHIDYMDSNLAAVVDSRVATIPHALIYQLLDERPEVRKLMWRQTLVQAAIFKAWLMRNSHLPAHASLAHFFCEMFTRAAAAGQVEGDVCDLPLTQELVADALGLTPVHTNRTLRVLRDTGFVEWRSGKLHVRDFARLRELAAFDPRYLHLHCA